MVADHTQHAPQGVIPIKRYQVRDLPVYPAAGALQPAKGAHSAPAPDRATPSTIIT